MQAKLTLEYLFFGLVFSSLSIYLSLIRLVVLCFDSVVDLDDETSIDIVELVIDEVVIDEDVVRFR